jgi:transcriptional regulator with XRE-family HTH domain
MTKVDLDYIKDRRIELKLSLRKVANELGFKNASTYLKYENGDYSFKAEQLPQLAEVLNCEIQNFFY